jgi:hypothetical protein
MGELLSILAVVLLLGLIVYSVSKQRGGMSEARAEEEARTAGGDVQRQRSLKRRADARAAAHRDR